MHSQPSDLTIAAPDLLRYSTLRILGASREQFQFASNRRPSRNSVMGAYHFRNLGDSALGFAVRSLLAQQGEPAVMENIFRISRLPARERTFIGGGALGTKDIMRSLCEARHATPESVHLLGIDFAEDVGDFDEKTLRFLRAARTVSVRSRKQMRPVSKAIGRDDVAAIPDLAFAIEHDTRGPAPTQRKYRQLGFNLLPLFMQKRGRRFFPGTPLASWYRARNMPMATYTETLGHAYIQLIHKVLEAYQSRGYQLVHLPFTPEDDLFARTCLSRKLRTRFLPFTNWPHKAMDRLRRVDLFLATRFHAHVFALSTRTPVLSICYGSKCEELWQDLLLPNHAAVRREAIVDNPSASCELLMDTPGVTMAPDVLHDLRTQVRSYVLSRLSLSNGRG